MFRGARVGLVSAAAAFGCTGAEASFLVELAAVPVIAAVSALDARLKSVCPGAVAEPDVRPLGNGSVEPDPCAGLDAVDCPPEPIDEL